MDALLAPRNEDVFEQKNHLAPNTNNAQKSRKPGQHCPGLPTTTYRVSTLEAV